MVLIWCGDITQFSVIYAKPEGAIRFRHNCYRDISAARAAPRTNLLYPARYCVSLVICSMISDIHSVMLLLYDVIGLPRLRFPLTFPWITHFTSSHPPSLIVYPKKESLRRTKNPRSCLVVLSSVRILSSVRYSAQLIRHYAHCNPLPIPLLAGVFEDSNAL